MKHAFTALIAMTASALATAVPTTLTPFADQTIYDQDCNGTLDTLIDAGDGFLRTGFGCSTGSVSLLHFDLWKLPRNLSSASFTFRDAGSTVPGSINVYAYTGGPVISLSDYFVFDRTGQFELAAVATIESRDFGMGHYQDVVVDVTDAIKTRLEKGNPYVGILLKSTGPKGVGGGGGGASDICSRESSGFYAGWCGIDGAPRLTMEFENRLPEPSTLLLSLGALAFARRTRRR